MSTVLEIENSRESNLADYAWLSAILISVLLFCLAIILLTTVVNGLPLLLGIETR